MDIIWTLFLLFLLLYPASFLGRVLRSGLKSRAQPFDALIFIATYVALVLIALPVVA